MINHTLSINKLIVLYMLNIIDIPLTNSQLSDFIIENEYSNYFLFQKCISEMLETDFILGITNSNSVSYKITEQGKETIEYFGNRLSDNVKEDIKSYLNANKYKFKSTYEVTSEYIPTSDGEYIVHLVARDKSQILMDLNYTVYSENNAKQVCERWNKTSELYYTEIINMFNNKIK